MATVFSTSALTVTGSSSEAVHEEGTFAAGSFALGSLTYSAEGSSAQDYGSEALVTSSTVNATQTASFALGGALQFQGTSLATGTEYRSDSLSCVQHAQLSIDERGTWAAGSLSLSSFHLTASTDLTANEDIRQQGSDTTGGANDLVRDSNRGTACAS